MSLVSISLSESHILQCSLWVSWVPIGLHESPVVRLSLVSWVSIGLSESHESPLVSIILSEYHAVPIGLMSLQ